MTAALQNSPMVQQQRPTDAQRIEHIRNRLNRDAPRPVHGVYLDGAWCLVSDDDDLVADGVIARFSPEISDQQVGSIANAPAWCGYLLSLVDRAATKIRAIESNGPARPMPEPKTARTERCADYAAEAAIKCGKPAFRRYMVEAHGMDPHADKDETAKALRDALEIKSRGELNAAGRWLVMKDQFETWLRNEND